MDGGIKMFNILVVDDEKIAVLGIKKLLRTYRYPLKIYEAYDGEEAKQILEQQSIHILMTDIELPFINGLELIEIAKKKHPHIKTIVFSAYSNFEYARKAISLNTMQYLLKPIEVNEFQRVMKICLEQCEKEFGGSEDNLIFKDIFINGTLDDKLIRNISFFSRGDEDTLYAMCYMRFNRPILETKELDEFIRMHVSVNSCVFRIDETQCVVGFSYCFHNSFKCYELYRNLAEWLKGKDEKNHVFFVCTEKIESTVLLFREIEKMFHLKELYFYFCDKNVFLETNSAAQTFTPDIDIQVVLDAIYQDIAEQNYWAIKTNISKLLELLELNRRLSPIYVKYIFFDIVKKLQQSNPEVSKDRIEETLANISKTNNIKEIEEEIQPLIVRLLELDENQNTYNQKIVERLLDYIHYNYQKDISLESLSEVVSLSPAYTSTIFKQITNQTTTAYINAYRMRMAKQLLIETNKKLVEIFPLVGYSSLTYFCVLFKNMFGETPSQYRKKKGKGDKTV